MKRIAFFDAKPYDKPSFDEYGEKYGVGDLSLTVHIKEGGVDWFMLDWCL